MPRQFISDGALLCLIINGAHGTFHGGILAGRDDEAQLFVKRLGQRCCLQVDIGEVEGHGVAHQPAHEAFGISLAAMVGPCKDIKYRGRAAVGMPAVGRLLDDMK